MIKLHPQQQQLINLLLILILGRYEAHIYLDWLDILYILIFTFFLEHLFYYIQNKKLDFVSFSSLSTAIGVVLMMVSTDYSIYFIVIAIALAQKHFLSYQNSHFFNPSNFALMAGLFLFYNKTHFVLGQLGHNIWLAVVVIIVAIAILYRIKRWIIPIFFLFSYLILQYFIVVLSDPMLLMESVYYRFYSVSFIVFILFMLTDPRTTPQDSYAQLIFAFAISLFSTLLDYYYGFRVQHLFMALFFLSPWSVLIGNYNRTQSKKKLWFVTLGIIILSLSVIIYIEIQPPYYFEMDK